MTALNKCFRIVKQRRVPLIICILILITAQTGLAQAGRVPPRTASPSTSPAPKSPTGDDRETISRQSPAKEIRLRLIATDYVQSVNMSFETGVAYRSFLTRFEDSGFLLVSSKSDVRRKEAIDLAKSGEGSYVAWLQLEVDLMGSQDAGKDSEKATITPVNPACLYVSYAVFAPGTGNVVSQGRTYQPTYQDRCSGDVYHPSPYPDQRVPLRVSKEAALKQAGRDAADKIMASLDLPPLSKQP